MDKWLKDNIVLVQLLGGIIATAITVTAYAYTTFQTKAEHLQAIEAVQKRLDRIEDKIDRMIEGMKR